jgi:hypothetical protein
MASMKPTDCVEYNRTLFCQGHNSYIHTVAILACKSWWSKTKTKKWWDACQQSHNTTLNNTLIAL